MTASLPDRPKIKQKCELQCEGDRPVLLYPEGIVNLNRTGFEILELANGDHSLDEIVKTLEERHGEEDLHGEIREFLTGIHEEGLLTDAGG